MNQQSKTQAVSNQSQAGTGSDLTSSMYGKGHVALNKVNVRMVISRAVDHERGSPDPFRTKTFKQRVLSIKSLD